MSKEKQIEEIAKIASTAYRKYHDLADAWDTCGDNYKELWLYVAGEIVDRLREEGENRDAS